jgi:hypothetical protein
VTNDPVAQDAEPIPGLTFSVASGTTPKLPNRGEMGTLHLNDPVFLAADLANTEGKLHGLPPFSVAGVTLSNRWLGIGGGVDARIEGDLFLVTDDSRLEVGGDSHRWIEGVWYRVGDTSAPVLHVTGSLVASDRAEIVLYATASNQAAAEHACLLDVTDTLELQGGTNLALRAHPTEVGVPELRVGSLKMASSAVIWADGTGYARRNGSGEPGRWGYGPGRGYYRGGGGYGGAGHPYDGQGGQAYGSSNAPVSAGSAGGSYGPYGKGGPGGGLVRVTAKRSIELASGATITANGGRGSWDHTNRDRNGGGGAGGGIYLACRNFAAGGGAVLSAAGGDSARYTGGGGGGGRIAVWRINDDSTGAVTATAAGGRGREALVWTPAQDGEAGTIVWGWIPAEGTVVTLR